MRILTIRGENLASLEGAFEVDFEKGPLAHAGLFAITGPTGAGKTTLLDALCLALFGKTPRIEGTPGRGHAIGRTDESDRITTRDTRMLLRRGAGQGHAEVAFLGSDGTRYVARWTVRRARNKPNGRLQNVEMELRGEDGIAIGRTLTEVQREIQTRLGLDYEQFCRSVLLAQGEFAAFLRADEKKRAELLEAVTGTGIYRDLSIAAHQRYSETKRALEALRQEHQAQPVLAAEEREALEAEHARTAEALAAAKKALQQVAGARDWYEDLHARRKAEAKAEAEQEAAETAWDAAEPTRARLAAVDAVLPLQPLVRAADESQARLDSLKLQEQAAIASAEVAAKDAAEARTALEGAQGKHKEQVAASEKLGPELRQAAQLDAEVLAATRRTREAAVRLENQVARMSTAREQVEELRREVQELTREREELERWIAEHASWQPVEKQWERWRDALERVAALDLQVRQVTADRATRRAAWTALREEVASARNVLQSREAFWTEAKESLASAEARRPQQAGVELREAREGIDRVLVTTRHLESIAREAADTLAAATRIEKELASRKEAAASASTELAETRSRHGELEREVVLAAEAERDARAVLKLEAHRADLQDGKPCPLCGSESHPWSGGDAPPAAQMASKWHERLEALQTELRRAERRMGELAGQAAEHERQAVRLGEERVAAVEQGEALQRSWLQASADLTKRLEELAPALARVGLAADLEALPEAAAGAGPSVHAQMEAIGAWREQIAEREAEHASAEAACAEARKDLERAREDLDQARTRVHQAEQRLHEAEAEGRTIQTRLDGLEVDCARLRSEVTQAFSAVEEAPARIAADPQAFVTEADETIGALRDRLARRERVVHQSETKAASLALRREEAERVAHEEEAARAAAKAEADALAKLQERRAGLLDGRPVSAVEESLRAAVHDAEQAVELARQEAHRTASAEVAARSTVRAISDQMAKEGIEAAQRAEKLRQAADAIQLAVEEVRLRLETDPAEVAGWRKAIDQLLEARKAAAIVLAERRREREEKESKSPPSIEEEAVAEALAAAEIAHTAAEETHYQVRIELEADRRARERSASYLPRIEEAERAHQLWEKMHELIGAANGDKFQLFAQSLTLDALLHDANAHLEELAPRYRLERAPGASLELQVIDRDMADEVRSTNSLSGGEGFLVSLALALGLSALSSHNTRVESLFIDEGFGTLDPQTLDTALATLDALQAAGRKVGLISHVQGMAERIGVQVQVVPQGRGCSRVAIRAA